MSHFDSDYAPNTTDQTGLYSYRNQPAAAQWNLSRLAEAFALIFPNHNNCFADAAASFSPMFQHEMAAIYRRKLGLLKSDDGVVLALLAKLIDTMENTGSEYTHTFSCLTTFASHSMPLHEGIVAAAAESISAYCQTPDRALHELVPRYQRLMRTDVADGDAVATLRRIAEVRPINLRQQLVVQQAQEELRKSQLAERTVQKVERAHAFLQNGKKHEADLAAWKAFMEEYSGHLLRDATPTAERQKIMEGVNPRFLPWPWVLQTCIDASKGGDYHTMSELLLRCEHPFEEDPRDGKLWKCSPPAMYQSVLSCSS